MRSIPSSSLAYGFVCGTSGPHSSRTLALADLRQLLCICPASSGRINYRSAAVDENVLLKQTMANRRSSIAHLRALYGLDPDQVVFRALRDLWDQDEHSQPALAVLCALARDTVLRSTVSAILGAAPGERVPPEDLAHAAYQGLASSLSESTLAKIGRNTAATWSQSGHLSPGREKSRCAVHPGPMMVVYALFLGYLCGQRGQALYATDWARLLDAPEYTLREQTIAASRAGWVEYRCSGDVTEITFRHLLRNEER